MMRVTDMRAGILQGTVTVSVMPAERRFIVVEGVTAAVSFSWRDPADPAECECGHGCGVHRTVVAVWGVGTVGYRVSCPYCPGNRCVGGSW